MMEGIISIISLSQADMLMWARISILELVPPPPIQVVSFRYMTCLIPQVLSFWVGQLLEELRSMLILSLSLEDMLMWGQVVMPVLVHLQIIQVVNCRYMTCLIPQILPL